MAYQKFIYTLIYLFTISQVISSSEACDKSRCKGPIAYYEDLKCTPIYGEDKCCPVKYNCDHLNGRSTDKCHYNGHVYAEGETLRDEDANPCDKACTCVQSDGIAQFQCAVVDCYHHENPDCFMQASHDKCCNGPEVCPKNSPDLARCEVDGKTYFAGQRFEPKSDPTQSCICAEGYSGKNVEPFCKTIVHNCGVELRQASNLHRSCPPVFYSDQNPATSCNVASRCQKEDDVVLPAKVPAVSDPADVCKVGSLTMKIGDELNQATIHECIRCVCEVPPLPTCRQLTDNECNLSV